MLDLYLGCNCVFYFKWYRMVYLGRKEVHTPPISFEEHFKEHRKDQSAAPGREESPAIILNPVKVGPPVTKANVRELDELFRAAQLGVQDRTKERSKVTQCHTFPCPCPWGAKISYL